MAFVTAPWQLFALRALLGVFAGYGALTISMAAESAPRDRMAQAIGMVQTGHRLGPAVGPVIGGLLAPIVGLRNAFLFAAAFYAVALIAIVVFYQEARESNVPAKMRGGRAVLVHLFRLPGFLLALGVIFGLQTVDRSFGPVLPLYVAQVGVPVARIPIVTGILFSLGAISAAFGHHLAGRLMNRRSPRTVIVAGALLGRVRRRRDRRRAVLVVGRRGDAAIRRVDRCGDDDDLCGGRIVAAARRARDRFRHHDDGVAAGIGGESGRRRVHRRIRIASGFCRRCAAAGTRWSSVLRFD